MTKSHQIAPARGKLGILLPGMGAVASTFLAGCFLTRRGLAEPTGSLTQLGTIRLGKRTDERVPKIRDFVPLADLNDLVFGGWDVFENDVLRAARDAAVLEERHLAPIAAELEAIKPMPAAFYPDDVKRLHGTHVKQAANKAEMVERLRDDIRSFKREQGVDRLVAVWCGSTERYVEPNDAHESIAKFEKALERDDPSSPSPALRCTPGRASRKVFPTPTARRT
jgi:myo-inositol-1-phosphate synthase